VRSTTGGSIGNGPSSPWSATTAAATMSPMGNFGSFALPGSSGQPATPSEKRPGLGGLRGESRLAHLMPKDSSEDMSKANEGSKAQEAKSWRARGRTDTDPFGDEPPQSGSAALGGGQDISPPMQQQRRAPGLDTPTRQSSSDFGLTDVPGFRDALQGHVMQTPLGHGQREPDSPTETNPYASPPDDRAQRDEADEGSVTSDALHHLRGSGLGGIAEHPSGNFGMSRGFPMGGQFDGSDRSQTSSATGSKGFPSLGSLSGLGGLGGLGGWPTTGNPIGTPDRERSGFQGAFGNSIFGPMGDMQSPGLGGLGAFGPPSASMSNPNTIGRGSKLGSLFPAAMQAQMHNAEGSDGHGDEHRQNSAFGAIGRNAFGPPRETDSPMRTGRGVFDDLFQASDFRGQAAFSNAENSLGQTVTSSQHSSFSQTPGQSFQQSQSSSDQSSNSTQLPQSQQRTMVMPDRMRWVYLDPQGQVQGPWSGLEMHDWYKASFFTADLSVKKVEDAEFEPLGQLIRRIGNSREPFLVPQIGVPHGPPTTQAGAPFAPAAAASSSVPQAGVVQPPFAGAFPSFGTTLTAEQQNNLERRKQEEQYLMARQREFLAQQQVNMKQMQMQGGLPSALHHHSSAHSLQSQPSFGSITSPIGPMPPQQIPAPVSAFFDNTIRPAPVQQPGLNMPRDFFREDEIARLSLQDRQQSFGIPMSEAQAQKLQLNPLFSQQSEAQRAQILQQQELEVARARELQRVREQQQQQQQRQNDPEGFHARLREFEQLRAQHDAEQAEQAAQESSSTFTTDPIGPPQSREKSKPAPAQEAFATTTVEEKIVAKEDGTLSLTEQVQKAAAASTKPTPQPQSPWAKVNPDLPMPFPPPPQSTTPLPAPMAQRGRSNLPDALTMGSRSRSETPETMPSAPSIAPWAKEPVDTPKGPSLKEIQEAEAKKAAKLEEAAAAARRALLEQEMRTQPVAAAPGLPSTSTWGTTSPAAPTPATSAWAKGTSKVATASPASAAAKKTLAEIQREEESRKQKLAAANAGAAAAVPGIPTGGKRYADLASKPSAIPATIGSAWSTVGHGGKVKIPTGPAAAAPSPLNRPASSTSVPIVPAKVIRPTIVDNRSTTSGPALPGQSGTTTATMEFMKWCKNALAKGLHSNINGKTSMCKFVREAC
jgi:PERQ amino acid-rich with GYF domain-containing protein